MISEKALSGVVLDKKISVSLAEICQACSCQDTWIMELVDYGILEPLEHHDDFRFPSNSVSRAYTARRLQRDLGINIAGVALALELLDELELLRRQVRSLATFKDE